MGARIRAHDWAATPLGPIACWPQSLRVAVNLVVATEFPSILFWGSELIVCAYNYAYRPVLGQKPEVLGRPALEVWAEIGDLLAPQLRTALAGQTVTHKGVRFTLHRHGQAEEAYFDYCFTPVRDDADDVAGVLNTAVETTAVVRREVALRESEARHRALFDQTAVGAMHADLSGRWFLVNRRLAEMLGYDDPADLVGRTFWEMTHPDDRAADEPLVRAIDVGELSYFSRDKRYVRKDGSAIWVNVAVSVVRDPVSGKPLHRVAVVQDVSERKEAEETLRESRERLEAVAAHAAIGVAQVDLEGRFVLVNDRQCEILGRTREELLRGEVRMLDVTHPDDRPENVRLLRHMLKTSEPFSIEKRYLRPDGSVVWAHNQVSLARNAGGTPRYITALVQNVTEHRRAKAALRASEARWRGLFESMQEGVAICEMVYDAEGRAVDYRHLALNAAWGRLTGVPNEKVEGKLVSEAIPGIEPYWLETYARVVETGEPAQFEYHLAVYERWFEVMAYRTEPGRFAAVFLNVTERKRAEAALRDGEARLRIATEANGIGTWELIVREDGTAVAITSPRHDAIFGYAEPVPEWNTEIFFSHIIPEDREAVARTLQDAVGRGETWAFEARVLLRREGEARWIEAHGQPVEHDAGGRAVRFVGIVQDITPRKAAEERLRLLAREVDHRAKNALAVVQSVVQLTPAQDAAAFKRAIEGRVSALARAQTLLAEDRWSGADLRALLEGELAPFRNESHRVTLEGPSVMLPPGAAQPLAMAAHELATNALKHGALSALAGSVSVAWRIEGGMAGTLRLRWAEAGGPAVSAPPARRGFGSRVLDGTIRGQLGGTVSLAWESTGLVCEIQVPLGRGTATTRMADTATAAAE
jgi:PAS domain S-box-containing protein